MWLRLLQSCPDIHGVGRDGDRSLLLLKLLLLLMVEVLHPVGWSCTGSDGSRTEEGTVGGSRRGLLAFPQHEHGEEFVFPRVAHEDRGRTRLDGGAARQTREAPGQRGDSTQGVESIRPPGKRWREDSVHGQLLLLGMGWECGTGVPVSFWLLLRLWNGWRVMLLMLLVLMLLLERAHHRVDRVAAGHGKGVVVPMGLSVDGGRRRDRGHRGQTPVDVDVDVVIVWVRRSDGRGRLELQLGVLLLLHGQHHLLHPGQHIELEAAHAFLDLRAHLLKALFQVGHLVLEVLHLPLLVLGVGRTSPPRRALNVLEKVAPSPFEVFVEEGNVLGGLCVEITVPDRLGLHLAEPVKVELTGKAGELVVVKVLRDDLRSERVRVLDDEHVAILRPIGTVDQKGISQEATTRDKER